VQGEPRKQSDSEHLEEESPSQVRSVKVGTQKDNAEDIAGKGENRGDKHLAIRLVDLQRECISVG
jgi:hypothetical protein